MGGWQAKTKRETPYLLCDDLLVEFHEVFGPPAINVLMLTSGTKVGSYDEMIGISDE